MRVTGYKLRGYDATYEPVVLDIHKGKEDAKGCVLTLEEVDTGIKYIFDIDKNSDIYGLFKNATKQKPRTDGWIKQGPAEEKHQIIITHGKTSRLQKK